MEETDLGRRSRLNTICNFRILFLASPDYLSSGLMSSKIYSFTPLLRDLSTIVEKNLKNGRSFKGM
jgi:hypothetical protein